MFQKGQLIVNHIAFLGVYVQTGHRDGLADPQLNCVYECEGYSPHANDAVYLKELNYKGLSGKRICFCGQKFRPLSDFSQELTEEITQNIEKEFKPQLV